MSLYDFVTIAMQGFGLGFSLGFLIWALCYAVSILRRSVMSAMKIADQM